MSRRQITNRVINKQGYLRKLPNTSRLGASFKRPELRWFLLGVFDGREPYLEYYASQEVIFTAEPLKHIPLTDCTGVMRSMLSTKLGHEFCVQLPLGELRLVAASRADVSAWCEALHSTMTALKLWQASHPLWTDAGPRHAVQNVYGDAAEVVDNRTNARASVTEDGTQRGSHHLTRVPTEAAQESCASDLVHLSVPPAESGACACDDLIDLSVYDVPPQRLPPGHNNRPLPLPPADTVYKCPKSMIGNTPHASSELKVDSLCIVPKNNHSSGGEQNGDSVYVAPKSLPIAECAATASPHSETSLDTDLLVFSDCAASSGADDSLTMTSAAVSRSLSGAHDAKVEASDAVDGAGEIYEPVWNKNADERRIPPTPSSMQVVSRRASRVVSMVAGQGRPAGAMHEPQAAAVLGRTASRHTSVSLSVEGASGDDTVDSSMLPTRGLPSGVLEDPALATSGRMCVVGACTGDTVEASLAASRGVPAAVSDDDDDDYDAPPQLLVPPPPAQVQPALPPRVRSRVASPHRSRSEPRPAAPAPSHRALTGTQQAPSTTPAAAPAASLNPLEPISPLVPPPTRPSDRAAGGATSPDPVVVTADDVSLLPPKMAEALGAADPVGGWNVPPPDEGAPPPYQSNRVLNKGAHKCLKQSQVELLQAEQAHPGGVKVTLRRADCHHALALVSAFGTVWVAGWNQKARPYLHNAFHVGDQVISINFQVVTEPRLAYKLIKNSNVDDEKVVFIVKRVPHARVLAVRRETDGQDLGLRRNGGTGEVLEVEPFGLVAQHGLSSKAPTLAGDNLCTWWITEVNHRPVSMFFRNDELEKRLSAVGLDISLLVMPSELVFAMRAQLKLIKNYKDFVVT